MGFIEDLINQFEKSKSEENKGRKIDHEQKLENSKNLTAQFIKIMRTDVHPKLLKANERIIKTSDRKYAISIDTPIFDEERLISREALIATLTTDKECELIFQLERRTQSIIIRRSFDKIPEPDAHIKIQKFTETIAQENIDKFLKKAFTLRKN